MALNSGINSAVNSAIESENYSRQFKEIDFSDEGLGKCEFDECTFVECNFSASELRDCKFIDCSFSKCNFSNAKVSLSRFVDVEFNDCKLIGVDWTRATWSSFGLSSALKFYQCILNDSSFFGLELPEIVMEGCKAHDVDLREGSFVQANFSHTDFTNSLFHHSNLTDADFSEALNYTIDVYNNVIKGARFSSLEAVSLLSSLEIILVD